MNLTVKERIGETRVLVIGSLLVGIPVVNWRPVEILLKKKATPTCVLIFDLTGVTALDLNGSAQILTAISRAEKVGWAVKTTGLPERFTTIFQLARKALARPMAPPPPRISMVEELGRTILALGRDIKNLVAFTGELIVELFRLAIHPLTFNWHNVLTMAERSGVNSVPIVALVAFLVGLIIAFQAAMLLKMFKAEIYVATLVGISVVRELGPLIAAIVLAGRSGSAFSAELGAMRAAEEVDALITMGLSPVRELALSRVLAQFLTTPVVTLIACFVGIMGGSLVLLAMGYTLTTYWVRAIERVSLATFLIGFFKSFIFGFTVGAISCQRGLTAGDGPRAVGVATTSGVVTNIVVIAILDSFFAVIFYVIGL